MYELNQLGKNTYYIESPTKIGVVKVSETEVVFIDGGSDDSAAKKALHIIEENGWKLKAVYNTHAHADHIGGNRLLQSRTGCKCYIKGAGKFFAEYPIMEPSLLFGAYPCKEICNKFLMAEESKAEELTANLLPQGWSLIDLPGHTADMVGFCTPDNVLFLADVVMGEAALSKHPITYLWDVKAHLQTLQKVVNLQADYFVPAHADVLKDIKPLAEYNLQMAVEVGNQILKFCQTPMLFETLLKEMFDFYGHRMNFQQYTLVGSTLRSYLSYLKDEGRLIAEVKENYVYWKTVNYENE